MADFTFAHREEGFDKHIEQSIRGYSDLIQDVISLSRHFIEDNTNVVDIGCSTGKMTKALIDYNLDHCNNTTARYTKIGRMMYVQFDITWPSTSDTSTAGFTLPFALQVSYGSGVIGWTDNGKPLFIHVGGYAYVMDNNNSIGNASQHTLNSEISGKRLIGNLWYIA